MDRSATVGDVMDAIERIAPRCLAMSGDNVGLLLGDPALVGLGDEFPSRIEQLHRCVDVRQAGHMDRDRLRAVGGGSRAEAIAVLVGLRGADASAQRCSGGG